MTTSDMTRLLSPSGRIGPDLYLAAMMGFAGLAAVLSLANLVTPQALFILLALAQAVPLYAVIVLGIQRSHDAGKSGWWVMTHLLLWHGVWLAVMLVSSLFSELRPYEAFEHRAGPVVMATLTNILAALFTAMGVNRFNPQQPERNRFGSAPAHDIADHFD